MAVLASKMQRRIENLEGMLKNAETKIALQNQIIENDEKVIKNYEKMVEDYECQVKILEELLRRAKEGNDGPNVHFVNRRNG